MNTQEKIEKLTRIESRFALAYDRPIGSGLWLCSIAGNHYNGKTLDEAVDEAYTAQLGQQGILRPFDDVDWQCFNGATRSDEKPPMIREIPSLPSTEGATILVSLSDDDSEDDAVVEVCFCDENGCASDDWMTLAGVSYEAAKLIASSIPEAASRHDLYRLGFKDRG